MDRSHIYAHALSQVASKGNTRPHELVASLHNILKRRGELSLMPRIRSALERITAKDRHAHETVFFVAREGDVEKYVHTAPEQETIRTVIDPNIIGGYRVQRGSTYVDASYRRALLDLYRTFTN